ncbi:MAG: hypothetical protein ACLS5Z_10645 [Clostridium fessum]
MAVRSDRHLASTPAGSVMGFSWRRLAESNLRRRENLGGAGAGTQ